MPICSRIWKLQKQRPQQRQSRMRIFFRHGVKVGKEPVASFDEAAPDVFLRWSVGPHFVIPCALLRMVAIDRLKRCDFKPLGEQLGRGRSRVASYVGSGKSESAEPQIF